jgi:hypothetical protein
LDFADDRLSSPLPPLPPRLFVAGLRAMMLVSFTYQGFNQRLDFVSTSVGQTPTTTNKLTPLITIGNPDTASRHTHLRYLRPPNGQERLPFRYRHKFHSRVVDSEGVTVFYSA